MEWIEPKTDWKVEYDENGNYIGDYVNAEDLNRIIRNLTYLIMECKKQYETNDSFNTTENPLPVLVNIGEPLDLNLLLSIVYNIRVINYYVHSTEVVNIVDTGVLKISRIQTPTWEFYNAVEQIMKLEHEQIIKTMNDKRKLKYQFGIPNTGGF